MGIKYGTSNEELDAEKTITEESCETCKHKNSDCIHTGDGKCKFWERRE